MSKIKPVNGYIVVQPEERKELVKGGIVLPDTENRGNHRYGEVISIYEPETEDQYYKCKVGDKVIFNINNIIKYEMPDNSIVKMIREEEIIAILED